MKGKSGLKRGKDLFSSDTDIPLHHVVTPTMVRPSPRQNELEAFLTNDGSDDPPHLSTASKLNLMDTSAGLKSMLAIPSPDTADSAEEISLASATNVLDAQEQAFDENFTLSRTFGLLGVLLVLLGVVAAWRSSVEATALITAGLTTTMFAFFFSRSHSRVIAFWGYHALMGLLLILFTTLCIVTGQTSSDIVWVLPIFPVLATLDTQHLCSTRLYSFLTLMCAIFVRLTELDSLLGEMDSISDPLSINELLLRQCIYILFFIWLAGFYQRTTKRLTLSLTQQIEKVGRQNEKLRSAVAKALDAKQQEAHFLSTMSHEIRTPLNGVLGMAELLQRTKLTEEQQEYVESVAVSGKHLLTVITDILTYSKIQNGRLELVRKIFDLQMCIEEAIDLAFHPATMEDRLEISYVVDERIPTYIVGDVVRVRQILTNLLSNAFKFTDQGEVMVHVRLVDSRTNSASSSARNNDDGRDRMSASAEGDAGGIMATAQSGGGCGGGGGDGDSFTGEHVLEFSVTDTGIGIAEDKRHKLFKPFSQVDSSVTRDYDGTGLGLAMSNVLTNMMGGHMRVESELGSGSTFFFTLPISVPSLYQVDEYEMSVSAADSTASIAVAAFPPPPTSSLVSDVDSVSPLPAPSSSIYGTGARVGAHGIVDYACYTPHVTSKRLHAKPITKPSHDPIREGSAVTSTPAPSTSHRSFTNRQTDPPKEKKGSKLSFGPPGSTVQAVADRLREAAPGNGQPDSGRTAKRKKNGFAFSATKYDSEVGQASLSDPMAIRRIAGEKPTVVKLYNRVLVVHSNANVGDSIARHLRVWGLDSVVCGSIAEATKVMEEGGEFDLAIVDVILSDGSGVDLISSIHEWQRQKHKTSSSSSVSSPLQRQGLNGRSLGGRIPLLPSRSSSSRDLNYSGQMSSPFDSPRDEYSSPSLGLRRLKSSSRSTKKWTHPPADPSTVLLPVIFIERRHYSTLMKLLMHSIKFSSILKANPIPLRTSLIFKPLRFTRLLQVLANYHPTVNDFVLHDLQDGPLPRPRPRPASTSVIFEPEEKKTATSKTAPSTARAASSEMYRHRRDLSGVHSDNGPSTSVCVDFNVNPLAPPDETVSTVDDDALSAVSIAASLSASSEDFSRTGGILLAEDNKMNQKLMKRLLKKLGHDDVDIAENGSKALEFARVCHYDLILMDIMMPVMDGITATKEIRKMYEMEFPESVPPPVVALTANATETDRDECVRAGMADVLFKPVSLARVEGILKTYIEEVDPSIRVSRIDTNRSTSL